eukprot:GHVH01008790.1.p1 GENE.GHVH01008790.1~~GHVH01008790.1.p1  ORF type:complete len:301 (+),score=63.31 GHVH01008790.1:30-932(+)
MKTEVRPAGADESIGAVINKNKRNRKEKPWDDGTIDHWKIDPFTKEDNVHRGPIVESNFKILFPKYRERYLQEAWPLLQERLGKLNVKADLDLRNGRMTVTTTPTMFDPFAICKARDVCKLLARSVPFTEAIKALSDEMCTEVIKIGGYTRNQDRFVKRRDRLVGPSGSTLKALELTTGCYFMVQGTTVAILGPWKKMKYARRIVEECMSNKKHPVYHVKESMIRNELSKKEEMKEKSWNNYLPNFSAGIKKSKKKKVIMKTSDTPSTQYPPLPVSRKIDKLMDTGEYFLQKGRSGKKKK